MQSQPLTKKQLAAIGGLIIFCGILLLSSIFAYNDTFFVGEKKESTSPETPLDIIPISASDPIIGTPAAPITVIGFEDFLCESCRAQQQLISTLLDQYPSQVKFIWKDLSISTIPVSSELLHVYGYCMNDQGLFTEYKDTVFNQIFTTTITHGTLTTISETIGANIKLLEQCTQSDAPTTHIDKNKRLAEALHIQRVPTFFVNGTQIPTPNTLSEWITTLNLNQ